MSTQTDMPDLKGRVLGDRLIIKPDKAESIRKSGIIIPENAKEKPVRGTVILAGPGTTEQAMVLKEGDRVLYSKYAGTEVDIEDNEGLLVLRMTDVMYIFPDEKESI